MPPAKRRLDTYVYYTLEILKNRQVAKSILADAKETRKRLSVIADLLKYVMIRFLQNMNTGKFGLRCISL